MSKFQFQLEKLCLKIFAFSCFLVSFSLSLSLSLSLFLYLCLFFALTEKCIEARKMYIARCIKCRSTG